MKPETLIPKKFTPLLNQLPIELWLIISKHYNKQNFQTRIYKTLHYKPYQLNQKTKYIILDSYIHYENIIITNPLYLPQLNYITIYNFSQLFKYNPSALIWTTYYDQMLELYI